MKALSMNSIKRRLDFFNGLGGFSKDGREYVIVLENNMSTPAPWVNVVSNPKFGFQISESGAGYTWSENSRENKLTPWSNDPVSDPPGEVIYLRDEDTGEFWTTTCSPIREKSPYLVRHGQGYSVFEHESHSLAQRLTVFAAVNLPVKIYRLQLKNLSAKSRSLSATFLAEWVLGVVRTETQISVNTYRDARSGALLAKNPANTFFSNRIAFAHCPTDPSPAHTGDRREFLGENGTLARPAGMMAAALSGRVGPGCDPCAVLRTTFRLRPRESREIVFLIGQAKSASGVTSILNRFRKAGETERQLRAVHKFWDRFLGAVEVRTPDRSMDLMLNRWLLYQTLSCRMWSRSAFYQSGGAFGFRDQLQDSRALMYAAPALVREHILRSAARQFVQGDVQHWWHPPFGLGPRSRCSDDLLFLPYVISDYLSATGDKNILDVKIPYVEGRPLRRGEHEYAGIPRVVKKKETLYDHCLRALRKGIQLGRHGLPLMGSCDWNDGMNRVGHRGQGESVWLGWFLIDVMRRFAPVCELRGDFRRASTYRSIADELAKSIEKHAWDGRWYRRAYMDDGAPLGSAKNDECKIDSLAQSWAVISGAAQPARALRAMKALDQHLVRRKDGLILLLTPPFDRSKLDPGYIKGYVPGVRENGGQYTHASTWVILAFAMMRDGNHAAEMYRLINPINHARTPSETKRYKVEPYVMAADVYGTRPHVGRGGWTWYTGSAAWMYRVGLEWILGLKLQGKSFTVDPCVPSSWPGFSMIYRSPAAVYRIRVENNGRAKKGLCRKIFLDGNLRESLTVPLLSDRRSHSVRVLI